MEEAARNAVGNGSESNCCLPELFTVETDGGAEIAASGFTPRDPDADKGKIVVVLPSAATPRYFYASFCCYLSSQGFPAVTFDYRGIGGSRPANLRTCTASLSDWGHDLSAVLGWLNNRFPEFRLIVVGHGLGGQLPALATNADLIEGLVTLSAASHYHGHFAGARGHRGLMALTRFGLPRLVDRLGYVPAKRLKLGEDVPKNVFIEWARWCRDPDYLFGDSGLDARTRAAKLHCPVLATIVLDDNWAPDKAVRALHQHYVNADVSYWPIGPSDFGIVQLGHLGPFGRHVRERLWPTLAQWIDAV